LKKFDNITTDRHHLSH